MDCSISTVVEQSLQQPKLKGSVKLLLDRERTWTIFKEK